MPRLIGSSTMSFSLYETAAGTFTGMLSSLDKLLDKGAEHAAAEGWPAERLPNAKLAEDMYPLTKQIQIACDHAKNAMARLAGQEPPRVADEERTIPELKERIARTIAFIEGFSAGDFADAEDRRYVIPLIDDLVVDFDGGQLLRDWHLPHFYFHAVTAYDILRHAGVVIGKPDYMSHIGVYIRRNTA
jgi:hypothetical protein